MNIRSLGFARTTLISAALVSASVPARAQTCPEPPEQRCDVVTQFPHGRWSLSGFGGEYRVAGHEIYNADLGTGTIDTFEVSGVLNVEHPEGDHEEENYIDVGCDGEVTGRGWERISGTITKNPVALHCGQIDRGNGEMTWNVLIERRYSVSGRVVREGELELTRHIESATFNVDGHFAHQLDCIFFEFDQILIVDITGEMATEAVSLIIDYDEADAENGVAEYKATIAPLQLRTWMDEVSHRTVVDAGFGRGAGRRLLGPLEEIPPEASQYLYMFLQESTEVAHTLNPDLLARTPVILDLVLEEPKYYLEYVPATTRVTAEVDWRRAPEPWSVTFTYEPGQPVSMAADPDAVFEFDAGAPYASIEAVATGDGKSSLPFVIDVPKVAVPPWAGTSADWSAAPGIRYASTIHWPITLEATRTIDTLSLLTGLWGLTGSAESTYEANAFSDGTPRSSALTTTIALKVAGREAKDKLNITGTNHTALSCAALTTAGEAEASIPAIKWKETINPFDLIPAIGNLCIDDKGILCGIIEGFGVKLSASVDVTGFVDFASKPETGQIAFTAGSVLGEIAAGVEVVLVPKPLDVLLELIVTVGGGGCMLIDAAPMFAMAGLGGKLHARAEAYFIFLGTAEAEKEWLFGDACHTGKPVTNGAAEYAKGGGGWVPADGQLVMALGPDGLAAAVWTEPQPGAARPSGDIVARIFRQGQWESPLRLTDDVESDIGPAAAFDRDGNLVVVYLRNETLPLPTDLADVDAFAVGFELFSLQYDPESGHSGPAQRLTSNASTDFGVFLKPDANGDLHAFWQRAEGTDLLGSAAQPASILAASRIGGAWGPEETVADDLEFVFGWSPAAASGSEMMVAMVIDTDHDLGTTGDREIFTAVKRGGPWGAPQNRSQNALLDDSPLAAFDASGEPILWWRSAGQIWQLAGDAGSPQPVIDTADPGFDDGVGASFGRAAAALGLSEFLLWPDGTDVLTSRRDDPAGVWGAAQPLIAGPEGVRQLHAARLSGNTLRVAYSSRGFSPDGLTLDAWSTPAVAEQVFPGCLAGPACDVIFRGDFE